MITLVTIPAIPTVRRRGILSAELLLTLPILIVLLFGLLEFSLLFFARGDVVDASRAGARAARIFGAGLTPFSVPRAMRVGVVGVGRSPRGRCMAGAEK
ncbi:MAG: hypothetical protein DWH91_12600, partial [Planctomycetota bacterium]